MAPLSALQRKLSHHGKEKVKRLFHVTVLSATGMSRSIERALFVFARGDHEFESSVAEQELGSFLFNERVSQEVTLFRNDDNSFEPKEYKLALYTAAGDKRGPAFAGGKIDLARYANQKSAKRVVLLLDPPSNAKGERKPVTVVLTVAAEGTTPGEAVPLESFSPAEEPEERSPPSDEDEDGDDDDSAPSHRARGPHSPPSHSRRAVGSDDEEEDSAPPGDHRVSSAKGASAKPLPAPPPPVQADEFDRQLQ